MPHTATETLPSHPKSMAELRFLAVATSEGATQPAFFVCPEETGPGVKWSKTDRFQTWHRNFPI